MRHLAHTLLATLVLLLTLTTGCTPKDQIVTSVSLGVDSIAMEVGERTQLQVIVLPLSATISNTVYWKSSDPRVATVDSRGNVTAVYSGSCYITATCNHITARCKVNVGLLTYALSFDNATAYFYGDAYQNQTTNTTLRLFDDGLYLDVNDNIKGAGFFLNLDLIGAQNDSIPEGNFTAAIDSALPQTFLPGALVERDGIYYAAGTFLGQYTTDGLGVVFITSGTCSVSRRNDNTYVVKGQLTGADGEEIDINYVGNVDLRDRTDNAPKPEVVTIDLSHANITPLGNVYNNGMQVYRLTANNGNHTLQLECYAPLSSSSLPMGQYVLSGSHEVYRLVPAAPDFSSGSMLLTPNTTPLASAIIAGTLVVESNGIQRTIVASLRTADGRIVQTPQ